MHNTFTLQCGNKIETFKIPFTNIIKGDYSGNSKVLPDIGKTLSTTLKHPLGLVDFTKLNTDSKVILVCDDYTRPTPAFEILPTLINFLVSKDVKLKNIDILIAAGFHREMTDEEKLKKFGKNICENHIIYHHDALDENKLVYLGDTKTGVPAYINKRVIDADFVIGVGVVEIHPWAGFSGGSKIICPGIAGKKTINHTHAIPVLQENVEIGTTSGNPFWECNREVSSMAGLDMIINVVLNNDEKITQLYAGQAEAVQNECIKFFKSFNQIEFDKPADIVITTSNPKHHYWGQAAIAGYNAARVVKKGGTRIIISECSEGFGDSQQEVIFYFDSLKQKWDDLEQYWEEKQGIELDNSRNTCAVHRHLKLLQKSECIMVTRGFPVSTPVLESQMVAETMESALAYALKKHGKNATIIIYDMGGMVLPSIRQ